MIKIKRLFSMCVCASVMWTVVGCIGIEGAPVAPNSPQGVNPISTDTSNAGEPAKKPPQKRARPTESTPTPPPSTEPSPPPTDPPTNPTEPAPPPTEPPPPPPTDPPPPPPTEPPPPPPTEPPPPPPTEPPSSGLSCADIQQASCKTDADCPSDKPYCSNEIFLTNGVQFRTCLPCKGHAFAEGFEDSSCKGPATWTRYGGDGCKVKGMKLYQMVPCMKCKTPSDGNFARVVQLCVENTCPIP